MIFAVFLMVLELYWELSNDKPHFLVFLEQGNSIVRSLVAPDFSSISNLRKINVFFAESGVSSNAMKSRELIILVYFSKKYKYCKKYF